MKKIISIILSLVLVLSSIQVVFANNDITVKIDGQQIAFDVSPQIINGRTMVPLRAIFESLGATVEWNNNTRTVTAENESTIIRLTIDDDMMSVNGTIKLLDAPACIVNGRTMVPVRAISEAFGAIVDWDGTTNTVIITTDNDSYKTAIKSKDDFIKYVKEYGRKQNSFYYVSAIDSNNNKIFLYYMPEESDSILIGYNSTYGTEVLDLVYVLKENDTTSSYSGTYTVTQGNKKLEYTFDGSYKAIDINKYYTPKISGFTVEFEGVDMTGRDLQNDRESKELLQTLITENFVLSIISAQQNFNLYPASFNFKSLLKVNNTDSEKNVSKTEENNTSKYEEEYNVLIEWGNQKVQEISEEAQKIYNQTIESEKRRYFPNYDSSNLDGYAAYNMQRQLDALMPTIKQSAELASKAYEADALETLAAFLQDEIEKLKQKYDIR